MVDRLCGCRRRATASVFGLLVLTAASAAAQGVNAMIEGVVRDPKGAGVAGAVVTFRSIGDDGTRSYQVKTEKDGRFTLIGVYPTVYRISASLGGANLASLPATMRLAPGQMSKIALNLNNRAAVERRAGSADAPGASGADPATRAAPDATSNEAARVEEGLRAKFSTLFDQGVEAAKAGEQDAAIARFTAALAISPSCAACYKNIGYAYAQTRRWPAAEEAYRKAIEFSAIPDPDALNGLAAAYTAQKKYVEAAEASAKAAEAAGGGDADALYVQAVNLFNANRGSEAKAPLQAAIKINPAHADAHYMLGLVLVGEGDTTGARDALGRYVQLAPGGKDAPTAKALLETLK